VPSACEKPTVNHPTPRRPRGRGTDLRPRNRFIRLEVVPDPEAAAAQGDGSGEANLARGPRTEFLSDSTRSIVSRNDSPDIPFTYSLNPYRGCEHGCAYCYARPSHEFLGFDAGLDFETKIVVKHQAPELFRDWLNRPGWDAETIAFSSVTDCYQPIERTLKLTRGCLEVAAEARQPIGLITKNALLARDLDLLEQLNQHHAVNVTLSVTTLDATLARLLEPRTSSPAARLRTITTLSDAGIPVRAMLAPIIPGLTDSEIPAILEAVADAGALSASWQMLRLPLAVEPIFLDWVSHTLPNAAERVISRIRSVRNGELSDTQFGRRMTGTGPMAEQIRTAFDVFAGRHGLDQRLPPLSAKAFRPPTPTSGQLRLFS